MWDAIWAKTEAPPKRKIYLRVLQGHELAACDDYGPVVTSDPYCIVEINGKEIGRTATVTGSLNPVFPPKTFLLDCPLSTRVIIRILDWDMTTADDPMGQVSFVIGDYLRDKTTHLPNIWLNVTPTEDSVALGRIEIQLFEPPPDDPAARKSGTVKTVTPGPHIQERGQPLMEAIENAKTPVFLNIYDVGHSRTVHNINSANIIGGVFHGGVEIFHREFSYGGCKNNRCGIFHCPPRRCAVHNYRETIYLGDCALSKRQIQAILTAMKDDWMGTDYDMLRKNCVFFCRALAIQLGVGEIPNWVDRLAHCAAIIKDVSHGDPAAKHHAGEKTTHLEQHVKAEADDHDLNTLLLEHIYAVRLQQRFRMRRASRRARIQKNISLRLVVSSKEDSSSSSSQ